jgi:hypothetical protein
MHCFATILFPLWCFQSSHALGSTDYKLHFTIATVEQEVRDAEALRDDMDVIVFGNASNHCRRSKKMIRSTDFPPNLPLAGQCSPAGSFPEGRIDGRNISFLSPC